MDENVRKAEEMIKQKIDPIYREVSKRMQAGLENSKYFPWIMERLMNIDQAHLVIALPDKDREPSLGRLEISDTFAEKLNLDKKTADKYVRELYEKGLLFPTSQGPQLPRSMGQWLDTQNNAHYDEELGDEYYALIGLFSDYELGPPREERIAARIAAGLKGTSGIIPRWKSIKDIPGVLPGEDIRQLLKAQEDFAVLHCACRKRYKARECGVPEEMCLVVGKAAAYNIDRRAGRRLTREEAFDLLTNETVKYPVVHVGTRTTDPKKFRGVICNCHFECCEVLRTPMVIGSQYPVTEYYAKSRYRATVDPAKCVGCGICVKKRCQFGAAQMKFYPEYEKERAYIDEEKCMGCGCCVETCPKGAHGMKVVEAPESYGGDPRMNIDT
jgi:electron transport complex protein RnfB